MLWRAVGGQQYCQYLNNVGNYDVNIGAPEGCWFLRNGTVGHMADQEVQIH